MTNPNVPRPNPDQNPGQNPYTGPLSQGPNYRISSAAENAQRGHPDAVDPDHRPPSSIASENQAYSAPGAPGNNAPEYASFFGNQGTQNQGDGNLPPTRPLPVTPESQRTSNKNKIVAGVVVGSLAAAALAGAVMWKSGWFNDNEGSKAAESKPAATANLFEYTDIDAVNAYGHKEGVEDFGNRFNLHADGSNKKEAAEDLIHKLKGNSEQMAHFLTFADYEAAGVPVPEIHDFRGADGNLNNRDQLAREMTGLGTFLHENRKSDAPEHEKVDTAVKWAETQIRENADKFGVRYVGAQYYDTNFLHHNNAGGFTTAYDDSMLLELKVNGQAFDLRADCGWQWWDVAHAPAQQHFAQASFTPEAATSVPVQAAAAAPQGEVQLLTQSIPWGPENPQGPPQGPPEQPPQGPPEQPPTDTPEIKGANPAPEGLPSLGVQGAPRPQVNVPQSERAQPEADTTYGGRTNPVPTDSSSNAPKSETGVRDNGADRSNSGVDTSPNPGGASVDKSNSNSSNSAGNGNPAQSTL